MSEAATTSTREVGGRTVPAAGAWQIDPAHSSFEFVARHLMTRVRGRFSGVTGSARIAERPEDSTVEVRIDAASVDTRNDQRDGHLRSPDFFNVEAHPEIAFDSTAVRPSGDHYKLDGELTVRGVSRPLTFDLEFLGASPDPWGNQRVGFTASADVNREDWDLKWNAALETGGWLLAKEVRLEIEVQLVRQ